MKSDISLAPVLGIIFATLAVFALGAGTPAEPPTPARYIPDIGTFMKIGYTAAPDINQATGEIFFQSSMTGVQQLYRITREGWPYQLTLFDDGINFYHLSYDGNWAIVGAAVGGSEDNQLFLLDTKTGRITRITDRPKVKHESVCWKKDGSGYYFRANIDNSRDFHIYYHDLASNKDTRIFAMEGSNSIANISPDERYMIVYHAYSNYSLDLYLIDLKDNHNEMITPGGKEVLYQYPVMMPDNNTIYLICNDNEDGILKLARMRLDTRKIEYLEPESKWTVDALVFSDNRRYAAWQVNREGYCDLLLWDMERDMEIPSPPVSGISTDPVLTDDGRMLFRFNSPTKQPDVWLWEWKIPQLRKITYSISAGIDPDIFIEPTLIKYTSFDGLEIPAFLYLPPDYDGKPIPFIIHAHGGPENQFQPYFQRHFQYLLLNGYGILAPNIRGSSGYGKEYLALDNYKNRMNSIKDIKAGVEYLIENNYTKKGMIGIKGASYGGYVVLASITEYPDLFSAAVDEVGIANFVTFLQNTRDYRRQIREAEYGPLSDEAFLKSISPIYKASLIKTPLLVVHGENDPRVPVSEARQIIEAIKDAGGKVDSLIFPDEGHGVEKLANRLIYYRTMVQFFDKYLKKDDTDSLK
jgi:dipeptidyl aminopeptidase/acylaminoacyl peptidase